MKASLIIFTYNQANYIEEALLGAFSQEYEDLEIIISDDCSSDHTYELISELVSAYDGPHKVRCRQNDQNMGLFAHFQHVMRMAKGEWIVVNAGDDVSLPHRVSSIMAEAAINPKLRAIGSAAEPIDEHSQSVGSCQLRSDRFIRQFKDASALEQFFIQGHFVLGAVAAWHRTLVFEFPIAQDLIAEDILYTLRARVLGECLIIRSQVLLKYRTGGISKGKNFAIQNLNTAKKFISESRAKLDVRVFARMLSEIHIYEKMLDWEKLGILERLKIHSWLLLRGGADWFYRDSKLMKWLGRNTRRAHKLLGIN